MTHQLQYLKDADCIVLLKHGAIDVKGTFQDLVKSGTDFSSFLTTEEKEHPEDQLKTGKKVLEDSADFAYGC